MGRPPSYPNCESEALGKPVCRYDKSDAYAKAQTFTELIHIPKHTFKEFPRFQILCRLNKLANAKLYNM